MQFVPHHLLRHGAYGRPHPFLFVFFLVLCSALNIGCSAGQSQSAGPSETGVSNQSDSSGRSRSTEPSRSMENSDSSDPSSPEEADRGVEVVERSGMYVYSYPETLHLEDPYENYMVKRRISDGDLRDEIQGLLDQEEGYTPEYTARCLPVYDYGIVIVDDGSTQTYLFSFRCNTMHYKEKKLWKDFSPIRARLYTLLTYQINDSTSVLIDEKEN